MEDMFVHGNLHLVGRDVPFTELHDDGIMIHVKGDVFFHTIDDDFIFSKEDVCIENVFDKYKIRDIIAYSTHENFKE